MRRWLTGSLGALLATSAFGCTPAAPLSSVAATFGSLHPDGSTVPISINGTPAGQQTATCTPRTSADPVTFGYANYRTYLNGALDEVRLYSRALSAPEVGGLVGTSCKYVYGLDLVSQSRNTGTAASPVWTTHYYGYDGLGSVRYLTDVNGAVTDTYTYDAFGILIDQTPATGQTVNSYRYTGEQWDADLGMYYLRARYLNPTTGRFWTADSWEGSQSDPLSLHKYLYCHNNPANGLDPGGANFVDVMGSFLIKGYMGAMTSAAALSAKGWLEFSLFMTFVGYQQAYDTGGWQAVAGAGLIDATPFGRVVRFVPSWLKRSQARQMANLLLAETRQAVPSAGWKAATSGLRFKQAIKEGSIAVKGMGGKGADVTADAIVNGQTLSLGRDLYALQGNLSAGGAQTLLETLRKKARDQLQGFAIREIQVEITEDAKRSSAEWLRIVREQVAKFQEEVKDVTVWLVDSAGTDIDLH